MHTDFKAPLLSEQKPATMYVWQLVNLVMAVFFSLAALANTNDRDWFLWVPIYILPAVLSVSLVLKPKLAENSIWNGVSVMYFTFCCMFAVYQIMLLMNDVAGTIQNPLVHETGRELGGLLIIIAWLAVSRFTSIARPSTSSSNKNMMSAFLVVVVTLTVLPLFLWSLCFVSDWHTKIGHCSGMFPKH